MPPLVLGQYSYHVFAGVKHHKSQSEAAFHCQSLNGRLLTIDSLNENNHIKTMLDSRKVVDTHFWTDYTVIRGEYMSSGPRPVRMYEMWGSGYKTGEDCVYYELGTSTWIHSPCDSKMSYICKVSGK